MSRLKVCLPALLALFVGFAALGTRAAMRAPDRFGITYTSGGFVLYECTNATVDSSGDTSPMFDPVIEVILVRAPPFSGIA